MVNLIAHVRVLGFLGEIQTRVQNAIGLYGGQTAANPRSERVLQRPVRVAHQPRKRARAEPQAQLDRH